MKTLLLAAAALSVIGSAALAQPAYDPGQGPAPAEYPVCSHPGQDRCVAHKGGGHERHGRHKAHPAKVKGERG